MTLSLQRRIYLSFLVAGVLVAFIGLMAFNYLSDLSSQMRVVLESDVGLGFAVKDLRVGILTLRGLQARIAAAPKDAAAADGFARQLGTLQKQLAEAHRLTRTPVNLERFADMETRLAEYASATRTGISTSPAERAALELAARRALDELSAKLSTVESDQTEALVTKQAQADRVAQRARQHMLLVMGFTLIAMVTLAVLGPPRVVVPLKKIQAAIAQVREANFDTEVNLSGTAELVAIGEALNKMVREIKAFDQLKVERIQLEVLKFESLCHLLEEAVLVCKGDGRVVSANNAFFGLFDVYSEDVLKKPLADTGLPPELVELLTGSLTRGQRLSGEVFFFIKLRQETTVEKTLSISSALLRDPRGELAYAVFLLEERHND